VFSGTMKGLVATRFSKPKQKNEDLHGKPVQH
jgi:hypothetical protein